MRPDQGEAQALADACPTCGQKAEPEWVQDTPGGRRLATYTHCTNWQTWWDTTTAETPQPVTRDAGGRTSQIVSKPKPPVTSHADLLCRDCGGPRDGARTHSRCTTKEAS